MGSFSHSITVVRLGQCLGCRDLEWMIQQLFTSGIMYSTMTVTIGLLTSRCPPCLHADVTSHAWIRPPLAGMQELEHTSATLAVMEASHGQLERTSDQYGEQSGLLAKSSRLLRSLNWQANSVRCPPFSMRSALHCTATSHQSCLEAVRPPPPPPLPSNNGSAMQHSPVPAFLQSPMQVSLMQERIMLWAGLALFACVVLYIVQKRVRYFVPSALMPSALRGQGMSRGRQAHERPAPSQFLPHAAHAPGAQGHGSAGQPGPQAWKAGGPPTDSTHRSQGNGNVHEAPPPAAAAAAAVPPTAPVPPPPAAAAPPPPPLAAYESHEAAAAPPQPVSGDASQAMHAAYAAHEEYQGTYAPAMDGFAAAHTAHEEVHAAPAAPEEGTYESPPMHAAHEEIYPAVPAPGPYQAAPAGDGGAEEWVAGAAGVGEGRGSWEGVQQADGSSSMMGNAGVPEPHNHAAATRDEGQPHPEGYEHTEL
jgi:hypothetical protein